MRNGDDGSRAIEAIVAQFSGLIRASGSRSGLSAAEIDDVTQELRVRLWKEVGERSRQTEVPAAYVRKVVRSAIIDLVRRRREHRDGGPLNDDTRHIDGSAGGRAESPETIDAQRRLGEEIERALRQLADTRRAVVRMWLAGYSRDEIAAGMGWTEAKVRNLLYRGLDDLRACLRAAGVETER